MALHISDDETDGLVRRLAAMENVSLTDAIKLAVQERIDRKPLRDRIRHIQDRIASYPKTGLKADKAFYDSLNDE